MLDKVGLSANSTLGAHELHTIYLWITVKNSASRETCMLWTIKLCGWQPCGEDTGVVYLCNSIDSSLVSVHQSH